MSGEVEWRNWNPAKVREMVVQNAQRNMAVACKLVEVRARAKLVAIQEPKHGRGYRTKVLAPRISYEIESGRDFVEGRVGIKKGRHQVYHGAFYIEIGTKKYPPHPWLRPAVFEQAGEIVEALRGG